MEGFISRKWQGSGKAMKECIVSDKITYLWGTERVCQVDHLTSADQVTPDWLKVTFSGEAETYLLGIMSSLPKVELSTGDSIWGLLFVSLTNV